MLVVVHSMNHESSVCRNGVSRAGVYCATSICTDQIRKSAEVDVFNAVRTVKQNRPQLVENVVSATA